MVITPCTTPPTAAIAAKHNLYGRDIKERALIDMYSEGIADLNEMTMRFPLCPPDEQDTKMTQIREKTTNRYFPAFEKVLKNHGQDYLIGNRLKAAIHLVELIYHHELGQRHGTKSPSEPFEGINFDDTLISDFRLLEL
ncbi:glutathione S-transferase A2-like [Myotis lucifugus]|uniref:glutathione S-transferase A2-like n=1 Tax=Myotis lucifugus TaxID=59463 RepID=UPI000CCC1968|nr:glutathione S-transferase A2-like [Myotis lucifugus]